MTLTLGAPLSPYEVIRPRRPWVISTIILVAIGITVRCVINFLHPYPPGADAAYYPLQTRNLLQHGHLLYDDLPLIFWINAAATKALMVVGWDFDGAVLFASRLVDCVLPPVIVVFVMALGYRWSKGRTTALTGSIAAGIMTMLWPPAMIMLSEFEKNSLGLVWMTAAIWASVGAMELGGLRRWMTLAGLMALAALTHIGAFAVTAVIIGVALILHVASEVMRQHARIPWKRIVGVTAAAAATVLGMAVLEPRRTAALLSGSIAVFRHAGWGSMGTTAPALLTILAICAPAARRLWKDRHELSRPDKAIVSALLVSALFLVSPKRADYLFRLGLMATVPAALSLTFLMGRRAVAGRSRRLDIAILMASLAIAAVTVPLAGRVFGFPPVVWADSVEELLQLRERIPEPQSTLVLSTHGLEWWAGYFLHTPVRLSTPVDQTGSFLPGQDKVPPDAFTRYRRVLYLRGLPRTEIDELNTTAFVPPAEFSRIYAGRAFELYEVQAVALRR